jgi:predicted HicB family RNase H-like nuclease
VPTKWAHFRISEETLERAKLAAAADRRSLSNWFALTIERRLNEDAPELEPAPPVT